MRRVRDAVYFFFVFTFPVVAAVVAWRLAATSTRTMATKPSNHNLNGMCVFGFGFRGDGEEITVMVLDEGTDLWWSMASSIQETAWTLFAEADDGVLSRWVL